MAEWFAEMFDERYLDFYEGLLDLSIAEEDVGFVDRALALASGARVLDLGCGFGRHALGLAHRGYRVTGLDLSEAMLERARAMAASGHVTIEWLQRDMRDLDGLEPFDACICLYTAFGFFSDGENRHVLERVHDCLYPAGCLMLDVSNPLALMRAWPQRSWRESKNGVKLEATHFDALSGRAISRRTLFRPGGTRVDLPETSVRMYPPHELANLLRDSGFEIEQVYGGLRHEPLEWNRSIRQVWVARRR
jgi:2-polyprenyl-3-methyl-5-hydroxy-6-metoxy-1,4-benzoquinol methylase